MEAVAKNTNWQADLALDFAPRAGKTRLIASQRRGPLTVQRAFYPEGNVNHTYLLHPPGGVVGAGHPNRRVGGKGGGGDANSGELREIKQSLNSVVDVLRNTAQAVAASASAAAGPLAAECTTALTARPRNILLTTSGSVTIPVTSVRMLITSHRQVRDAAERLVVLVPVLQASEDALIGLLQQQQGRN
jgi:hypothetical protein